MTRAAPTTVAELLLARADDDHPGLRFEGRQWSWRQVVAESRLRQGWIRSVGGTGPVHVGILLGNVPEYLFWLGAAALSGSVVVGINRTRRGDALAGDIRRTSCTMVVTDMEGAALLDGLDLAVPGERVLLVDHHDYPGSLERRREDVSPSDPDAAASSRWPPPAVDDLYLLLFTSGTTGNPKAVRCTQGRLASIALRSAEAYGFERDDVAYCTMPLFHGNALMVLWGPTLVVGGTVALARSFSASGFLDDVRTHGATTFTYVGKALAYVLATPPRADDATSTLRRGFGTEASVADHAAFEERFGCVLTEGYGSSEGGVAISRTPDTPPGSLGRPGPTDDVAVVDPDTTEECPAAAFDADGRLVNGAEAVGEIVNRAGIGRFEGYYADERASAERTRGGWYWTGDLAYRDQAGFFYFAGRRGDWMRVDSENLTAGPIERVLNRFGAVATVAVYWVPDPRSGDQVMAALELLAGRSFRPEEFGAFLADQPDLGTKWTPAFVRATHALPQTASGKVTKEELRTDGWWRGTDPVFVRLGGTWDYVPLDTAGRERLLREFDHHGRRDLLGG